MTFVSYSSLLSIESVMPEPTLDQPALAISLSNEKGSLSHVEPELVCPVQDPDAMLVVHQIVSITTKRFSVSTNMLSLASRYFDR
jgi:hypothetical protein